MLIAKVDNKFHKEKVQESPRNSQTLVTECDKTKFILILKNGLKIRTIFLKQKMFSCQRKFS